MDTETLGQPLNRYEARQKVTGRAAYAADARPAQCVYAVGVRSDIARGKVAKIDASTALSEAGVLDVLHVFNAPRFFRCPEDLLVGERRPPFEDDRVYYAGQYVAVVVANSFAEARWAARRVKVSYEPDDEPPAVTLSAGRQYRTAEIADEYERGDAERSYAEAAARIDALYSTPVEAHCAMELHAAVAHWEAGRLIVEESTQWVVGQRKALAITFGLAEEDVEVRSRFIGGGFGCKLFLWPHSILAAEAARRIGRPVKFTLDRSSEFTTGGHRPLTEQRVRLAADENGTFQAIIHDATNHTSLTHEYEESCTDATRSLYECPNLAVRQRTLAINTGSPTPMRGPGETPGLWALETAIDELAVALEMDPLALRLRNVSKRDQAKDLPWSINLHERCLREAAERFGWSRRLPQVGSMREDGEVIGWGIASATWPGSRAESKARVQFLADGRARVSCATQDIGTGTYTVLAQVVSSLTGLGFEAIDVEIGESRLPEGPISGGSMATASLVPAVADATEKAILALAQLAVKEGGPFQGADPEMLSMRGGALRSAADPGSERGIAAILAASQLPYVSGEAEAAPGDERDRFSFRSFGAHCVEVRWDPGIARLRVSRVTSVIDAGRIINRKTATNQVDGSIAMGLGMALMERTVYDERSGRVVTDNLADYLVPLITDMPEMDVTLLDVPDPAIGRFGARGIGEIGLTGMAPAIGAAVYHATGKRIRSLPISIEQLL